MLVYIDIILYIGTIVHGCFMYAVYLSELHYIPVICTHIVYHIWVNNKIHETIIRFEAIHIVSIYYNL